MPIGTQQHNLDDLVEQIDLNVLVDSVWRGVHYGHKLIFFWLKVKVFF